MSDLQLFIAGVVVAVPTAVSMVALVLAAVADGRENERTKVQRAKRDGAAQ